jgi:hypothetical protein
MRAWRTPLVSALALTVAAATPIAPVAAAPATPMPPSVSKAETGSIVTQVRGGRHYGGHRHHGYRNHGHRHHHRHYGRGVGVGIGLGIIGGLIAADAYSNPGYVYDEEVYDAPPPDYTGDPRALCAEKFRSFEPSTGLYTTYSGEKKTCPYLK